VVQPPPQPAARSADRWLPIPSQPPTGLASAPTPLISIPQPRPRGCGLPPPPRPFIWTGLVCDEGDGTPLPLFAVAAVAVIFFATPLGSHLPRVGGGVVHAALPWVASGAGSARRRRPWSSPPSSRRRMASSRTGSAVKTRQYATGGGCGAEAPFGNGLVQRRVLMPVDVLRPFVGPEWMAYECTANLLVYFGCASSVLLVPAVARLVATLCADRHRIPTSVST